MNIMQADSVWKHNMEEKALFEYLNELDTHYRSEDNVSQSIAYGMMRALTFTVGRTRVDMIEKTLAEILPLNPSKFFMLYTEYLDYCITVNQSFAVVWTSDFFIRLGQNDFPDYLLNLINEWARILTAYEEDVRKESER